MIITIDGKECTCEKGEFLLDIASRNGISIPTLCRHKGLDELGACRVCVVEIESGGWSQVVASCIYPVEKEMSVSTNSAKIKEQRKMILSLLNARAPESAEIIKLCKDYKAETPERFTRLKGEKCVLCGLCKKACESVGTGAISTMNRGTGKKVSTPYDEPSKDCVGCLSCANVCPASAIEFKENENSREVWGKSFSLVKCENCGKIIGTPEEIELAAKKLGAEAACFCPVCRRKAAADVLAETYGT